MHQNFAKVIPHVLKSEGGFVNNPKDPGGATNKGITLNTFRRYIKPKGTVQDLKNLTVAQAETVYKRRYWDSVMANDLPPGVDYAVFDFSVNSGPSRAAKYLQRVVGCPQDGRIGPRTLDACNAMKPEDLVNQLCDKRLAYMKRIKHGKTGARLWDTFGKGWGRRVAHVRKNGLELAAAGMSAPTIKLKTSGGGGGPKKARPGRAAKKLETKPKRATLFGKWFG